MSSIHFHNQRTYYLPPNQDLFLDWLVKVASQEKHQIHHLDIVLCSAPYLLYLNKTYLQHSTNTDIITFDYRPHISKPIEGELYIGLSQVRRQAKIYRHTLLEELSYVIAHGLLHLCGYKDRTSSQKQEMRRAEKRAMRHWQEIFQQARPAL